MRKGSSSVFVVTLLSLVAGVYAQGPTSKPVTLDQSTPRRVVKMFTKAIIDADVPKVRACLHTTSPMEEQFAQGYADVSVGLARLKSAMVERFGEPAARVFGNTDGTEELKRIDSAKVDVNGDRATIAIADPSSARMALINIGGQWKIDVGQMLAGRDADKLRKDLTSMTTMSSAASETAIEIKAGRYASMDKAVAAYSDRLKGGSTTKPAK